jgi:drug/metabolite transporter (DMT)-like permease
MALMFYCGNRAYLYLSVSFVQMLKTATPAVTMAVMMLFGLETLTVPLSVAIGLLTIGTAIASYGEVAFSSFGVAIMLLSEAADALRLVLTQLLLSSSLWHPIEALMYLAPGCAASLVLGVFFVEWDAMQTEQALAKIADRPLTYALAAVLGFAVNASATSAIKHLSSLTLKVVGQAGHSVLVVASCFLFGDRLTTVQLIGYAIALAGFVAYHRAKAVQSGHANGKGRSGTVPMGAPLWNTDTADSRVDRGKDVHV